MVLVAMLLSGVSQPRLLVLIATMGNSLGGLTNVILTFLRYAKISLAGKGSRLAKTLWRCHAVIKLDACNRRFTVSAGGMDAHFTGTGALFLCLGKALRYVLLAWVTLQGMTWWH